MKNTIIIWATLLSLTSVAQDKSFSIDQIYPIETSHSYVGFSVKYMGYAKVKGRFAKFNGSFRYDADNLENTSVSFSIDTESIDTDIEFRDRDLKSDNWFDVEKYPKITFYSTKHHFADNIPLLITDQGRL